jgi:SAM-dependent methyltransferase
VLGSLAPVDAPPLRRLDRLIRSLRVRQVGRHLGTGVRVLDVGCFDGALFAAYRDRIADGVGVDPLLEASGAWGGFRFVKAPFPSSMLRGQRFDVITLLAVLEHIDEDSLHTWRVACEELLEPGGRIIATVPSPRVDEILRLLARLHLVEGMEVHQHHGFDPAQLPHSFANGSIAMDTHTRFELGLNHLFVFRKVGA